MNGQLTHRPNPLPEPSKDKTPWSGNFAVNFYWHERLEPKVSPGQLRRAHDRMTMSIGTT